MRFKGRIKFMFLVSAVVVEGIELGSVCPLIHAIASKGILVPFLFLTSDHLFSSASMCPSSVAIFFFFTFWALKKILFELS